MKLEKISGGSSFGIDYHLSVILYPLPFKFMRKLISFFIRLIFKIKSKIVFLGLKICFSLQSCFSTQRDLERMHPFMSNPL